MRTHVTLRRLLARAGGRRLGRRGLRHICGWPVRVSRRAWRNHTRATLRRLRLSRNRRRRALVTVIPLVILAAFCWYESATRTTVASFDPKSVVRVTGEPAALASFGGLVVTASTTGHVSTLDPVTGRRQSERQLDHSVSSLAVLGSSMYALGEGRVTRMSPTLEVLASKRLTVRATMLAAGSAGLWAAGGGDSVVRVDPGTLELNARVPVRGHVGGLTVSASSIWVTISSSSEVLVIGRGAGRRFVVRRQRDTPSDPGPIVIANGMAWVLCPPSRRLVGYGLTDPRRTRARGVGIGAALLSKGNSSVYVGSPVTDTVTQYGAATLKRVGKPISVGGLPSAIMVDLHAAWVTSRRDNSLARLDLADLARQRTRATRRETLFGWRPEIYLGAASALTMLLLEIAVAWRMSDPDRGLPRLELPDICVVALDDVRWNPLSDGRIDNVVRSTTGGISLGLGLGGRTLGLTRDHAEADTLTEPPPERSVRHAIARLMRSGQAKRFLGYAPAAGGLLRMPSRLRLRPARLQERFLGLAPYTLCLLSGRFAVSRPNADTVHLQLRQLIDRRWGGWEPVAIPREAWLTVECAATALSSLGREDLAPTVSEIELSVLAVPHGASIDGGMRLQLLIAYYEVSF